MNFFHLYSRRSLLIAGAVLAGLLYTSDAFAQLPGFFRSVNKSKRDRVEQPTLVSADAMDIDMANNVATLLGNVDVDDQDMNIKCKKMVIYLEDKAPADAAKNTKKSNDLGGDSKQLSRIECIGDVVITRKIPVGDLEETQKATAGKAVYNLKDESITLTDKPILIKGRNRIKAERMILFTKSERMQLFKGEVIGEDSISNSNSK